jgi:dynein heavy chain
LQRQLADKNRKLATFRLGEDLFGLVPAAYPPFEETRAKIELANSLYALYTDVVSSVQQYKTMPLPAVGARIDEVRAEVLAFRTKLGGLPQELRAFSAAEQAGQMIKEVLELLPLLGLLTHRAMRARHWQQVQVVLQTVLETDAAGFCAATLLAAGLRGHQAPPRPPLPY